MEGFDGLLKSALHHALTAALSHSTQCLWHFIFSGMQNGACSCFMQLTSGRLALGYTVPNCKLFRLLQEAFVALIFAGVVLAWSENCHLTEEDSKQLLVRMSQMR